LEFGDLVAVAPRGFHLAMGRDAGQKAEREDVPAFLDLVLRLVVLVCIFFATYKGGKFLVNFLGRLRRATKYKDDHDGY